MFDNHPDSRSKYFRINRTNKDIKKRVLYPYSKARTILDDFAVEWWYVCFTALFDSPEVIGAGVQFILIILDRSEINFRLLCGYLACKESL